MSGAPTRRRLAELRSPTQLPLFPNPDTSLLLTALDEAIELLQPRNVPWATEAAAFREYGKRRDAFLKNYAPGGAVLRKEHKAGDAGPIERPKKSKTERTEAKISKVFGEETAAKIKRVAEEPQCRNGYYSARFEHGDSLIEVRDGNVVSVDGYMPSKPDHRAPEIASESGPIRVSEWLKLTGRGLVGKYIGETKPKKAKPDHKKAAAVSDTMKPNKAPVPRKAVTL